jgi:hypothetical protein
MRGITWVFLGSSMVLLGCGSDGSSSTPDSGVGSDAAVDAGPPAWVVRSDPSHDAEAVSILVGPTVEFGRDVQPSSVDATTVSLLDPHGRALWAEVLYDASTRTATIQPVQPLEHRLDREQYRVRVTGVMDTDGVEMEETYVAPFSTTRNQQIEWWAYTDTGALRDITVRTLDPSHRPDVDLWYDDPGEGPEWGVDDGVLMGWEDYIYSPDGDWSAQVEYHDPGMDGEFLTPLGAPDDIASSGFRYEFDAEGWRVGRWFLNGAGADDVWGTADDLVSRFEVLHRNPQGLIAYVQDLEPGPDGRPGGGDDVVTRQHEYTYDANGWLVRYRRSDDPGADEEWLTEDDGAGSFTDYSVDDHGNTTRTVRYQGPGADGLWLTDDDVIQSWCDRDLNELGLPDTITCYNGAGPDAIWLTDDDVLQTRFTYVYDDDGLVLEYHHFDAADERVSFDRYAYEADGDTIELIRYSGPGANGTWGDEDDLRRSRQVMDTEH